MPIIKYDYIARPHVENGKLVAIYRPIISIRLGGNHKIYTQIINCLVDSGADFNLFPAYFAESLGINIKKGRKVTHIGIGDLSITAYEHPIKLYLPNYHFTTTTHFSYDHKIPLLGRYSFFSFFKKVIFDQDKLRLILHH